VWLSCLLAIVKVVGALSSLTLILLGGWTCLVWMSPITHSRFVRIPIADFQRVVLTIRIHRTLAVSFLGTTLIVYSLGMDRRILFVISFDGNKALDSTSTSTKLETPDQWFPALNSLCRFRQPPTRDKAPPRMVSTAGLEYSASLKLTACFVVCMALLFLRQLLQSSPNRK
jgi:hypothetical protein